MRVLVSGGTGLIGRALVRELTDSGLRVVVLSRSPARSGTMPVGVTVRRWDARSAAGLAESLAEADAVVHLAGEGIAGGRWTEDRKREIRDSRVESSRAFAEAIAVATARPRVFLQASAVGYYGPRGDELVPEETPPGDDFLARVSREWEDATAPLDGLGVRRAVLRTGVVLTPKGGALAKMLPPFRAFVGGPLGSGRQYLPWIHVADEVGAIRFLLEEKAAAGPFNLTAPAPVTNREFSRALGRAVRRPSLLPAPAFALRLVLGEMAGMVLEGQRAVPRRLLEAGYRFQFPELDAALSDLVG